MLKKFPVFLTVSPGSAIFGLSMPNNYHHLGSDQRYQIEFFLKSGMSQKAIAIELGVHPSTISRELRRNTPARGRLSGQYLASNAQRRTVKRHQEKPKYQGI